LFLVPHTHSQVMSDWRWAVVTIVVSVLIAVNEASDVPGVTYVPRGASGSGWTTRYWDCCKPSCGWSANTNGGNLARSCYANGTVITDSLGSVCSSDNYGPSTACLSQIPFKVDDNLAYAFAAVPASNGGLCGRCFDLEFVGEGKYDTTPNENSKALAGKHMIVMCSNIGSDVNPGQFDLMIPGGGAGIYNTGCVGFTNWNYHSNYDSEGGLLRDCEVEQNYVPANVRSCLERKCNEAFSKDPEALAGCLFLYDWMHAASNPKHNYREVECPQALKDLY